MEIYHCLNIRLISLSDELELDFFKKREVLGESIVIYISVYMEDCDGITMCIEQSYIDVYIYNNVLLSG